MNRMKTRTILLLLGLTVLSGAFLTSCKDSGEDIPILKPLSEHLVGKWRWAESSGIKDGTWQEYIVPDDIYERVFLREDGTAQHIRTFDGGYMAMKSSAWTTDEETVTVTISGVPSPVLRLTADEFGFSMTTGTNPENGTAGEEQHWLFRRIDIGEKHPVENYLGRWVLSKTYEKKDGQWVETAAGKPDEAWHEYREDGFATFHACTGDKDQDSEMYWMVNCTTGDMHWFESTPKEASTANVTIDGDTMTVLYSKSYDPATGQVVEGEFKDVLILDK